MAQLSSIWDKDTEGSQDPFSFCPYTVTSTLLALMVGLLRLHCYRNGVLNLVFVEQQYAKRRRKELIAEDWVITHTEFV